MRICLLQCDHVDESLIDIAGDYDDMFRRLFRNHPEIELEVYDLTSGHFPDPADRVDGYLSTGSRHSVTDDIPWISTFASLVETVRRSGVRYVGICFGHQMLAHALGGVVGPAASGWSIGVKSFATSGYLEFLDPDRNELALQTFNRDQIQELPPGGEIVAYSQDCPAAALRVGETMLGFQGHPEFGAAYARELLAKRRGVAVPDSIAESGLRALGQPSDGAAAARYMLAFWRGR